MRVLRGLRTAAYAAAITVPPALYTRWYMRRLEERYPPLPPDTTGTHALLTPNGTDLYTPYVDIYGASVPVAGLLPSNTSDDRLSTRSLEELWARSFFTSKAWRLEECIIGKGSLSANELRDRKLEPGESFLAGNTIQIVRRPTVETPLLTEWHMPEPAVRFFETLAGWGYPWRLMNGGRHEWTVERHQEKGKSGEVEVRFASAVDYKIVEGEGEPGKVVPKWFYRLHQIYARFLLDQAVQEIKARAKART